MTGVAIPGATTPPTTYPGQADGATVSVSSLQTLITTFQLPNDAPTGGPNISVSVQVISDQPISVGAGFPTAGWSGACGPVSK